MYHVSISCLDLGCHRDAGDNVIGSTLHLQIRYCGKNKLTKYDQYTVVMETGLKLQEYFKLLYCAWPQERKNSSWIMNADVF